MEDILAKLGRKKYNLSDEFYDILYEYIKNKNSGGKFLRSCNFSNNRSKIRTLVEVNSLLTHYFLACEKNYIEPNMFDIDAFTRGVKDLSLGNGDEFLEIVRSIVERLLNEI